MIKSVKGQFILSIIAAILFVIHTFFNVIELTSFPDILFYFAMVITVYNAGLLTQNYIQTKKAKSN